MAVIHNFFRFNVALKRRMSNYVIPKKVDPRFKNPCSELQQFVEEPLFKEDELSFNPTIEDMKLAQKLFMPVKQHEIKYITSLSDIDTFPHHNLPEITFIGRNNVGKSSLLRALFVRVPGLVLKTSKKPGQEQTVNFLQVKNSLCLVDMPGYGFRQPESFLKAVEGYLKTRQNLKRTFLLVDGKVGFQKWDEVALDMLEEFKIPYGLVMTKIDKAIPSQRLRNMLYLQQIRDKYTSASCFPQPFMISSVTGEGIAYLQAYIAHITGNLILEGHS
ncbi:GTP-binding protein 8 [Trichonephila inaurata madagascariensis]|uniref:GTP-binding protein 8 n=1 Tax=Trichonephila inaurata madagascariensis TaxID=2747483 RepID=A0A8X6XUR3_9ARAC|nr:GTP-binding protein 8 [Trichonephila inaurata madagascariensis]